MLSKWNTSINVFEYLVLFLPLEGGQIPSYRQENMSKKKQKIIKIRLKVQAGYILNYEKATKMLN